MGDTNFQEHVTSDSDLKRRVLTVLFFSVFPLILPSIVYATIVIFSDLDSHRTVGSSTEHASISFPIKGKNVPSEFTATGTIKNIPDKYVVYISSGTDEHHWPKIKVGPGNWSLDMTAKGQPGYKYNLSIIAVTLSDSERVEQWFRNGKDTGKYPPMSDFKDLITLATIRVEK